MNGLAVVTVGSFATEQNFMTCGMVGSLERNIQLQALQCELLAKGKGVHREVESEGSRRQTLGPTNRNRM